MTNTDKKNQHYIPKFYLRNFSFELNEKQIGIYDIPSKFYFSKAKLKTQGSKNFFYGKDGKIEDQLSEIEGTLASQIKDILTTQKTPKKQSAQHLVLLTFVGLTHLRNPVLIDFIKNSREEMKNRILELDKSADTDKLVPEISHERAIGLALSGLKNVVDNLADLDYKLLVNKTKTPFITSDFPVVKYNQFLERKKWPHGKTGYGNIGLQIFIPINPEITIVFFDPMIYKVGFKKRLTYEITNPKDIDQLNILQTLNCFTTLFFNENISENYIRLLIEKSNKYQKANIPLSELSHIIKDGDRSLINFSGKKKNLVVMGSTDCEINLNITGIKTHSNSTKIKLTNSMAQMRPHTANLRKQKNR